MTEEREAGVLRDSNSLVNQYKIMTLEQRSQSNNGVNEKKTILAFQVLDEITPQLGVFAQIIKQLREDLYDSVYSNMLTSVSGSSNMLTSGSGHSSGYVTRIPYFTMVKTVFEARDEMSEELTSQLETVKERLFTKHQQLEQCQEEILSLNKEIEDLRATVVEKDAIIDTHLLTISQLQENMEMNEDQSKHEQHQLQCDIDDIQEELDDARSKVQFLQIYKKGYDTLDEAFQEKVDGKSVENEKVPVIATQREGLMSDLKAAYKLEEQLITVMNMTIEEYDRYLEDHKARLVESGNHDDVDDYEAHHRQMELNDSEQELEMVQERFCESVKQMKYEHEMIRLHMTMLQEQLQILDTHKANRIERKPMSNLEEGKGVVASSMNGKTHTENSILSAGLNHDEEKDPTTDPFIPQERIFSKYASMLYTSTNEGRTFYELKDAKFCPSCGEKTVICPHKLGGSEKVFTVPPGCTHLKIARPKVRINREFINDLVQPAQAHSATVTGGHWLERESTDPDTYAMMRDKHMTSVARSEGLDGGGMMVEGEDNDCAMLIEPLLDELKDHLATDRIIPRSLSLERTLSMMEQFYVHIVQQDENLINLNTYNSVTENILSFAKSRYRVDEVAYLACHDFLRSVAMYSHDDKTIQLFGHVVVGTFDMVCLRYILLMAEFINIVDWKDMDDFRAFAAVVYPFISEDDLESLQMNYTSFSENVISRQVVLQFTLQLILKLQEPRVLHSESRLMSLQSYDSGLISLSEYPEIIDNLAPLSSDDLRNRLFLEAVENAKNNGEDGVSVAVTAQIVSYLSLLQIASLVRETVSKRVEEQRARIRSAGTDSRLGHAVNDGTSLVTLAGVKTLAYVITKQAEQRLKQCVNENDW